MNRRKLPAIHDQRPTLTSSGRGDKKAITSSGKKKTSRSLALRGKHSSFQPTEAHAPSRLSGWPLQLLQFGISKTGPPQLHYNLNHTTAARLSKAIMFHWLRDCLYSYSRLFSKLPLYCRCSNILHFHYQFTLQKLKAYWLPIFNIRKRKQIPLWWRSNHPKSFDSREIDEQHLMIPTSWQTWNRTGL